MKDEKTLLKFKVDSLSMIFNKKDIFTILTIFVLGMGAALTVLYLTSPDIFAQAVLIGLVPLYVFPALYLIYKPYQSQITITDQGIYSKILDFNHKRATIITVLGVLLSNALINVIKGIAYDFNSLISTLISFNVTYSVTGIIFIYWFMMYFQDAGIKWKNDFMYRFDDENKIIRHVKVLGTLWATKSYSLKLLQCLPNNYQQIKNIYKTYKPNPKQIGKKSYLMMLFVTGLAIAVLFYMWYSYSYLY